MGSPGESLYFARLALVTNDLTVVHKNLANVPVNQLDSPDVQHVRDELATDARDGLVNDEALLRWANQDDERRLGFRFFRYERQQKQHERENTAAPHARSGSAEQRACRCRIGAIAETPQVFLGKGARPRVAVDALHDRHFSAQCFRRVRSVR